MSIVISSWTKASLCKSVLPQRSLNPLSRGNVLVVVSGSFVVYSVSISKLKLF